MLNDFSRFLISWFCISRPFSVNFLSRELDLHGAFVGLPVSSSGELDSHGALVGLSVCSSGSDILFL